MVPFGPLAVPVIVTEYVCEFCPKYPVPVPHPVNPPTAARLSPNTTINTPGFHLRAARRRREENGSRRSASAAAPPPVLLTEWDIAVVATV